MEQEYNADEISQIVDQKRSATEFLSHGTKTHTDERGRLVFERNNPSTYHPPEHDGFAIENAVKSLIPTSLLRPEDTEHMGGKVFINPTENQQIIINILQKEEALTKDNFAPEQHAEALKNLSPGRSMLN